MDKKDIHLAQALYIHMVQFLDEVFQKESQSINMTRTYSAAKMKYNATPMSAPYK